MTSRGLSTAIPNALEWPEDHHTCRREHRIRSFFYRALRLQAETCIRTARPLPPLCCPVAESARQSPYRHLTT